MTWVFEDELANSETFSSVPPFLQKNAPADMNMLIEQEIQRQGLSEPTSIPVPEALPQQGGWTFEDDIAPAAKPQQESGVIDELGRQLGRTGRMAVSGAASVLDTPRIVTDPLYTAGYYGAKALGADDAKEFFRQELARPTYGTMAKEKVDEVTGGVLKPRNTTEEVTDVVGDVGFSVIAGDKGVKVLKSAMTAPIWDDVTSGGKKAVDTAKKIAEKRALSSAKYKEALASKEVFPADFSEGMVKKTEDFIPRSEFEADLVEGSPSLKIANLLEKHRGKPLTIRDIDRLDKKLTDRAYSLWSTEPDEARKISEIQDSLRETLAQYPVGGTLKEARDLWSQQATMRDLDKMREMAEMTKNPQTALATSVKNYIKNEKRFNRHTDAEKELLRKAAKTGILTDAATAVGSRLNTLFMGAATGNPAAVGGAFLAGVGGRKAAETLQGRKLDKVIQAVEGRTIGQQTAPVVRSPLSREEIQAMSAAGAARVNPDSIGGLTEQQKLLPAPAIRLPDEVGKPTLDSMIPKQKLLPAPKATGEMAVTRQGQAVPLTGTESAELAILRKRATDLGLTPDVRKVAESFARRTKEAPAWNSITKEQQDTILTQINDAWKQYDKANKPSINQMIREAEIKARQLAKAKGESFAPTVLGEKLKEAAHPNLKTKIKKKD